MAQDRAEQLKQAALNELKRQAARRVWLWVLAGGAPLIGGFVVALIVVVASMALLAGMGHWLAGALGANPPAIATEMSRPAEWLDAVTAEAEAAGVPNVVALAVMNQASDGQAYGDRYYCSNGQSTGGPCDLFYHGVRTVGVGYGLMGIDSRSGLIPHGQDPHDVGWNLQTGLIRLGAYLREPYWKSALNAFHQSVQTPSGWAGGGNYADQIKGLVQAYDSGPTLGAWALAPWSHKTGQWEDPGHRPEWVFVIGAAPVGATGQHAWKPPTIEQICTKSGCTTFVIRHILHYVDLGQPIQVWGTTASGQHVAFALSTGNPNIPVWPGGTVWGAKVPLTGPNRLTLISAEWANGVMDTIAWPEQASGAPGYVQVVTDRQALNEWWPDIQVASQRTGVPADWIAAEMLVESHGDQYAAVDGLAGAYGLMQLEPQTARSLPGWYPGARQNPQENLILGAELLAELHAQFGSWRIASAAYYGGAGSVEAAGVTPGMAWAEAAPRLNVVPFASAGNTLTMAQYADTIEATSQWVATHAPKH